MIGKRVMLTGPRAARDPGCWQDHGSWQVLSCGCFPQGFGVLLWRLLCRPPDCVTLSEILAGANPSAGTLAKRRMWICP